MILFFESLLVVATIAIVLFSIYVLYRLVTDES